MFRNAHSSFGIDHTNSSIFNFNKNPNKSEHKNKHSKNPKKQHTRFGSAYATDELNSRLGLVPDIFGLLVHTRQGYVCDYTI